MGCILQACRGLGGRFWWVVTCFDFRHKEVAWWLCSPGRGASINSLRFKLNEGKTALSGKWNALPSTLFLVPQKNRKDLRRVGLQFRKRPRNTAAFLRLS